MDVESVHVQVVRLSSGREIAWGDGLTERLGDRVRDVHRAVQDGIRAIADGLPDLSLPDGWQVGDVSATFGVTLAAGAGVVLSRASADATFEVTISLRRSA